MTHEETRRDGPVKVAHVVLGLNVGGLERVVLRLLERLDRTRFAPIVCALDEPGELAPELARLHVPLLMVPRAPGLDFGLTVRLSRLLARERVELVHTHNTSPHLYGALAAMIARLAPGGAAPRVVHTKHGRNAPGSRRSVLLNRFASALSARVVAVSEDARDVSLRIERADASRVVTIVNGVDTDEYRPTGDRGAAGSLLGIPRGGFHVGCVARISPEKDQLTLVEAFARFRAGRPGAHLTIVGDGPARQAVEERARALGLEHAVRFAGPPPAHAPGLGAVDVFALSSRTEGIALTLIEAAASGLPIVATRVGGNAEVVVDGVTGLLVPPADPIAFAAALDAIASRPGWLRAEMGLAGRARVEARFGVDQMARAYQRLYTAVRGPPRGGCGRRAASRSWDAPRRAIARFERLHSRATQRRAPTRGRIPGRRPCGSL